MPVLRSVVTIVSRALSGARPQPCFREAETATGQGWAGLGWAGQGEAGRGWDEDQDPRLEVAGGW